MFDVPFHLKTALRESHHKPIFQVHRINNHYFLTCSENQVNTYQTKLMITCQQLNLSVSALYPKKLEAPEKFSAIVGAQVVHVDSEIYIAVAHKKDVIQVLNMRKSRVEQVWNGHLGQDLIGLHSVEPDFSEFAASSKGRKSNKYYGRLLSWSDNVVRLWEVPHGKNLMSWARSISCGFILKETKKETVVLLCNEHGEIMRNKVSEKQKVSEKLIFTSKFGPIHALRYHNNENLLLHTGDQILRCSIGSGDKLAIRDRFYLVNPLSYGELRYSFDSVMIGNDSLLLGYGTGGGEIQIVNLTEDNQSSNGTTMEPETRRPVEIYDCLFDQDKVIAVSGESMIWRFEQFEMDPVVSKTEENASNSDSDDEDY